MRDSFFKTPLPPSAKSEALDRDYAFEYESGKWAFGDTCVVRERASGTLKSVKTVPRKSLKSTTATLTALRKLKAPEMAHEHVDGLTDVFHDQTHLYIVCDKAEGGDVGEFNLHIQEEGNWLQEEACISYIRQALMGVAHSHAAGIYHRDILPSSLLLTSKARDANVRVTVADMGVAAAIDPENAVARGRPSPYAAPETYDAAHGELPFNGFAADVWSIGAIAHELLVGRAPANGQGDWAAMIFGSGDDGELWAERSDEARDFVAKLLRPVGRRPTAARALQHPWLRIDPAENPALGGDYQRKLTCYMVAVLLLPASMPARDAAGLRLAFKQADLDGDGLLSVPEVRRLLVGRGERLDAVNVATDLMDVEKVGVMDLSSAVCAALVARKFLDGAPAATAATLQRTMAAELLELYGRNGIVTADGLRAKLFTPMGREVEEFHGVHYATVMEDFPDGAPLNMAAFLEMLVRSNARGTPRCVAEDLVFDDVDALVQCEDGLGLSGFALDRLVGSLFRTCKIELGDDERGRRGKGRSAISFA